VKKAYDGECGACGKLDTIYISSSQVNDLHECGECGKVEVKRVWRRMPGVTRASYIDSNKTSRGKVMREMKEAAHLEVKKAGARPEDKADIAKEIHELTKIKK
jgi:predicted nucleic acid-binding Zn ribbon protein